MLQNMSSSNAIAFLIALLAAQGVWAEWRLTWSDDFNGPSGSAPDSSKWNYDLKDLYNGWGNNELQYYTNERQNSAMDGSGNLIISAHKIPDGQQTLNCYYGKCRYTSARLLTKNKFTQKYGKFEARIKLTKGKGIWPAFWLLGDNIDAVPWPGCGEIDIMEYRGSQPSVIAGTIHGPGYFGGDGPSAQKTLSNGQTFADDFHVFTLEWTDSTITWRVDGNQYHQQINNVGVMQGKKWVFDHPFFILLNVAVGGKYDGEPDGNTPFPGLMLVDYVRVYSNS